MIGENCENAADLQPKHHLCVVGGIAKADSRNSVIYGMNLSKDERIEGQPFTLYQESGRYIWPNERIDAEKLNQRSIVKYQVFGDISIYLGNTKRSMNIDQMQMALDYGENVFKSIKEVYPDAVLAKTNGMYLKRKPENANPFLVSLKSGFIKNERIHFVTRGDGRDHVTDLKLNCRENLTLSTGRVDLPIRRMTSEDDVGDLALIKFGTLTDVNLRRVIYPAVCEALILKFKPNVISTDEEEVEIKIGEEQSIVPGVVKFDTGNDGGTAMSHDLMEKLGLKPDRGKKFCTTGIGDKVMDCFKVKICLCIRKRLFEVDALVGAGALDPVARGTDLLIGNDIIRRLVEEGFYIGH